jgi:hypothetical protein
VRLEPKVSQNVVTYATVIDVPNNDLKLKPGMTANVNIEIARATNVLRIPNTALRFRPTNEMYAALGQTPPEPGGRGEGGFAGRRGGAAASAASPATTPSANAPANTAAPGVTPAPATPAAKTDNTPKAPVRDGEGGAAVGGRGAAPGADAGNGAGGRGNFAARMQNMTPEQRERFQQRMRERGIDPTAAASGTGAGRGRGDAAAAPTPAPARAPAAKAQGATTIDALFGPLPRVESVGRVWTFADNQLKPVRLRLGITDGQATELLDGDLQQGTELVTNFVTTNAAPRPAAAATGNPFLGQGGRGGFPGGGNRGGGR